MKLILGDVQTRAGANRTNNYQTQLGNLRTAVKKGLKEDNDR
jgi:hypothetical protein